MKRPIVHPATPAERALYATLHQAATAALRQPIVVDRTARKVQRKRHMRSSAES